MNNNYEELDFEGSPLKSEMTNTNKIKTFYNLVKSAHNRLPESKFWKDAFEFIQKRHQKTSSKK